MSSRPRLAVTSTVRVKVLPEPALALTTRDSSRRRGSLRSRLRISVLPFISFNGHVHRATAEGTQLAALAVLSRSRREVPGLQAFIEARQVLPQAVAPGPRLAGDGREGPEMLRE